MTHAVVPPGLTLRFEPAPSLETRLALGDRIRAFNARHAPGEAERFALLLQDDDAALRAGLVGVLFGGWLFVESLWVDDALRGQGIGRALMASAEDHARTQGCHDAWLDTFQARGFYEQIGYVTFAVLEDYPPGQSRHFLRKTLREQQAADVPDEMPPGSTKRG
jgi:GNAT superfamily N-acetyltransferase